MLSQDRVAITPAVPAPALPQERVLRAALLHQVVHPVPAPEAVDMPAGEINKNERHTMIIQVFSKHLIISYCP